MKKHFTLLCAGLALAGLFSNCSTKLDPKDGANIRKWMDEQKIKFLPGTLISAIVKGDTANANLYITAGLPIDGTDGGGNTALVICANKNNVAMVTWLLAKGADATIKGSKGMTPMVDAASLGNKDVVLAFVENEKKKDPQLLGATDALMMGARQGFVEVVKIFVEAGTPKDFKSNEGWTALTWATKGGHIEVVDYLISQGADVNAADKDGYTALDWAINENYSKVIASLKKAGGKTKK
jgi:ankyrin repeat protein